MVKGIEQPIYKLNRNAARFSKDKSDTKIAIELENETKNSDIILPQITGWTRHNEGSLRHTGFEYVFENPRSKDHAFVLVDRLFRILKEENSKNLGMTNSLRTSTHVHFDVTSYTFLDVVNFATVYWLLEEFLSDFCGDHRKGNLFCLRSSESILPQMQLAIEIRDDTPFQSIIYNNEYRYASLNLAALKKFGSLEFRLMRGTDDPETIKIWINILDEIKNFALKFNTPEDLQKDLVNEDISLLPERIFSERSLKVLDFYRKREYTAKSIRQAYLTISHIFSAYGIQKGKPAKEVKDTPKGYILSPMQTGEMQRDQYRRDLLFTSQEEMQHWCSWTSFTGGNFRWDLHRVGTGDQWYYWGNICGIQKPREHRDSLDFPVWDRIRHLYEVEVVGQRVQPIGIDDIILDDNEEDNEDERYDEEGEQL